jgi:hypothetical protein
MLSPRKSVGDVVTTTPTTHTATPAQPVSTVPNTPMDAGEFASVAAPKTPFVSTPMDANEFADASASGFGATAKFPSDLDAMQPTWMEIWSHKRTGVGIGSKHSEADFIPAPVDGTTNICLPIPSGVGTAYGHSWDQSDISMADEYALHADRLGGTIASGLDAVTTTTSNPHSDTYAAKGSSAHQSVIDGFVSGMSKNAVGTIGLKVAGDVLGGGIQQATGKAAFNEQVVHYSGPQFRQFEFSFSLKPMSATDQMSIDRIVRFLKIGSMPELLDSGGIGRVYELPLFFKIKFISRSKEMHYMNKIGYCALTGFNVKYGGDRFQTFSLNDAPVQTDISMSFKEISLLNKESVMQGY